MAKDLATVVSLIEKRVYAKIIQCTLKVQMRQTRRISIIQRIRRNVRYPELSFGYRRKNIDVPGRIITLTAIKYNNNS